MNRDKELDAFLSHSHEDVEWVAGLATRLEDEKGIRVWLDSWSLIPGRSWQQAMARGLDKVASCAVIVGENTPTGWFRQEVERALDRQAKDEEFRVIPVLAPKGSPENLPVFTELRTWADFREGKDVDFAFHVLCQGIIGQPIGRFLPQPPKEKSIQSQKEHTKRQLRDIEYFRDHLEKEVLVNVQMRIINDDLDDLS